MGKHQIPCFNFCNRTGQRFQRMFIGNPFPAVSVEDWWFSKQLSAFMTACCRCVKSLKTQTIVLFKHLTFPLGSLHGQKWIADHSWRKFPVLFIKWMMLTNLESPISEWLNTVRANTLHACSHFSWSEKYNNLRYKTGMTSAQEKGRPGPNNRGVISKRLSGGVFWERIILLWINLQDSVILV